MPEQPALRPPSGADKRTPRHGDRGAGQPDFRILFLVVDDLPGILDGGLHGLDLDVLELAADLADLAQVFVLDDVARLRVDRDRSARAGRALVLLEQLHGPVRVDLAFLLADRVVDRVHAVPGAYRHEARRAVRAVFLVPCGD